MRWKGLIFALLLAPLASCAEPARFDYYLLALSVAPAFCEDEPQRKQKFAQCRALSAPGFKSVPLTLHGLWPNRADRRHPAYCSGEAGGAFCRLPPLRLPADTRARLGRVMPAAADCLDRYQWAKHGSCSGLAEADYFAASAALTERVNRAIGSEIARHTGREIDLAVRDLVEEGDACARAILETHRHDLDEGVGILIAKETLTAEEFAPLRPAPAHEMARL
jgi:ribonuclease T2